MAETETQERSARRDLLEQYLLGTLDEGARAVLRAQAIASPQVFADVCETERDLLDARARGALDARRTHLVDTRLAVPNSEAWLLAQALAERAAIETQRTATTTATASAKTDAIAWARIARAGLMEIVPTDLWAQTRFFPAAAAMVLAASLWIAAPSTTVPPGGVPSPGLLHEAASERTGLVRLDARQPSSTPASVQIAPGVTALRIEVALRAADVPAAVVDVTIQDGRGRPVWTSSRVLVRQAVAAVSVPLAVLQVNPPGRYSFGILLSPADARQPAPRVTVPFVIDLQ